MIVKIRYGVIFRQPQVILRQIPEIIAKIALGPVEVDRRTIARVPDPLAECDGTAGQRLPVQAVGTGLIPGNGLPVEGHRKGQLLPVQNLQKIETPTSSPASSAPRRFCSNA